MKNKLFVTLIVCAIFVTAFLLISKTQSTSASVSVSDEYYATTTDSTWGTGCKADLASSTATATLGSVIVTLGSTAPLYIYDATTTSSHSDHATTTIAAFKTTATAGTYTFDVKVKRGICLVAGESTVGVASSTITFRP